MGVVLLYVASRQAWWIGHEAWRSVLNSFGALLIVSVAAGSLWALAGKRAFASEVYAIARISTDVQQAGIIRVGTNYREDPDWESLFATVRKLDIFVSYGRTWRSLQLERLRALAAKPDGRIRVFLPDHNDGPTIERLADRFQYTTDKLRGEIQDAVRFFDELRVDGGADVEVYQRAGHWLFSCYRFDQTAVLTLYSHQQTLVSVPTLVVRDGGSLYEFLFQELRAIQTQSTLVSPSLPALRSSTSGGTQ